MKKNYILFLFSFLALFIFASCGKKKTTSPTPNPPISPQPEQNLYRALDSNTQWIFVHDTLTNDGNFLAIAGKYATKYKFYKIDTSGHIVWAFAFDNLYGRFQILEPSPNQYFLICDNVLFEFDKDGKLVQQKTITISDERVTYAYKRPNGYLVLFSNVLNNNIIYRTYNSNWSETDMKELPFDRPSKNVLINDMIVSLALKARLSQFDFYQISQIRYDLNFNKIDSTLVIGSLTDDLDSRFQFSQLKVLRNNDLFYIGMVSNYKTYYFMMRGKSNITSSISGLTELYPMTYSFNEFQDGKFYLYLQEPLIPALIINSNTNHTNFVASNLPLDTAISNHISLNLVYQLLIQKPGTETMFVFDQLKSPERAVIYKVNSSGLESF